MKNLDKALIGASVFLVLVIVVYAHGDERAGQEYTSSHMMAFDAEEMDEMHDAMVKYIDDPELREAMDKMHESHWHFYEGNVNTGIIGHMRGMGMS